jgi:hypothetical protein
VLIFVKIRPKSIFLSEDLQTISRAGYATAIHRHMRPHESHVYHVNLFYKFIVVLKFLKGN